MTFYEDTNKLLVEAFGVTLSLDQIQQIVDMGETPTDYDLQKIDAMIGNTPGNFPKGRPSSTSILNFLRGFKLQHDTLYFDTSMVIPRRTDAEQ